MITIQHYTGLFGILLLWVSLPLTVLHAGRCSRRVLNVAIISMVLIAFIEIKETMVIVYLRGIMTDLSITSMFLLAVFIMSRYTGVQYLQAIDKVRLRYIIVIFSLLLYPFALGLGLWDSYRLGYGSWEILVLLSILSLYLITANARIPLGVILLSVMAFFFDVLVSDNLWDYMLDPGLAIVSVIGLLSSWISRVAASYTRQPAS